MLTLALPARIYLCLAPTDMRKSFDSLAALVRDELNGDPFSGSLFVFRSKRRDRIKLLYWDQDGFMLRAKKPESDCTHSFSFTGLVERGDNLARRLTGSGRLGASPSDSPSRR